MQHIFLANILSKLGIKENFLKLIKSVLLFVFYCLILFNSPMPPFSFSRLEENDHLKTRKINLWKKEANKGSDTVPT